MASPCAMRIDVVRGEEGWCWLLHTARSRLVCRSVAAYQRRSDALRNLWLVTGCDPHALQAVDENHWMVEVQR